MGWQAVAAIGIAFVFAMFFFVAVEMWIGSTQAKHERWLDDERERR